MTVDGERRGDPRGRELVIDPAEDIAEGADFTTVVTYGGKPTPIHEGTDIFDLGWQTDGREAFVVSEPSGAQTFFPVSDHPTDKATYTIRVTAPEDQTVAANGLLVAGERHRARHPLLDVRGDRSDGQLPRADRHRRLRAGRRREGRATSRSATPSTGRPTTAR